jgi:hypothetical protein
MFDRSDEGFFERAITGPAGKKFVDDRVMSLQLAVRSFVNRHFLPLQKTAKKRAARAACLSEKSELCEQPPNPDTV